MITFLYGEDSFRSSEKLAEIKNKFLENNNSGSGLSIIDYDDGGNQDKLSEMASSGGLFSSKQLIISKNLISSGKESEQEKALEFLKEKKSIIDDKDTEIIFWEGNVPKKTNKLFKFLEKNTKSQNFEKFEGAKLAKWITDRVEKNNPQTHISPEALKKLSAYAGDDLFQLDNEIKKLVNFKNSGTIEEKDVDLLVKSKIESNIFEAIEAMSSGNKKSALKLLHEQLEKGEDPFYIFSMYVYQFRNLLKIGELFFQGTRNHYQIAQETKLHPYVAQKGLKQLENFTLPKLKSAYKKLQQIDLSAKTGKIDIKLALDKFVVSL